MQITKQLFFFFCFFLPICLVKGDLPIHALMSEVRGVWEIKETTPSNDKLKLCGGGLPNENIRNLSPELQNYEVFLEKNYGQLNTFFVNLTTEKINISNDVASRNKWTYLAVKDMQDGVIGYWTMVYDEGFEIRLKGKRYFGLLKYNLIPGDKCPNSIKNSTLNNGNCYETDTTKTQIGWALTEEVDKNTKEKQFQRGCFYAQKNIKKNVSSVVTHEQEVDEYMNNNSESKDSEKMSSGLPAHHRRSQYKKIRMSSDNLDGFAKTYLADIYDITHDRIYACRKQDDVNTKIQLTLPRNFSWGDPYNNPELDDNVEDQERCGFCYAIASVYALKKRFEILLWNRYKIKVKMPALAYESIISCSPYNQGCNGGYPFLVGKHTYEYGIVPQETILYAKGDENMCKLSLGIADKLRGNNRNNSSKDAREVYYASGYNYINGCYECSNEYDMMNEIIQNGPIIAAINADRTLVAMNNINDKNIIYDKETNENKTCDIPNEGFNGWQETNHAITIVGWGEQLDENNQINKYWIIRNTWGKHWGYSGYMKFQRGYNTAGIETQAVYIDPDFSRGYGKELIK